MATGKTHGKYVDFIIGDTGNTLRSIPVTTIGGLGLTYDELDLTALQDAVKNFVPGQPNCELEITGPFTNDAAAAAGTLSGSHTVLEPLNGGITPRSLDIQVGIQAAWTNGDPQFGITQDGTSGVIVTSYTVDVTSMMYTASIKPVGGQVSPDWGTAAETGS